MLKKRCLTLLTLSLAFVFSGLVVCAAPAPAAPTCGCDVNLDGAVNLFDLVAVAARLDALVPPGTAEDTNADGKIDLLDLTCVALNYQTTTVPPPSVGAPVVRVNPACSLFDAPGNDNLNASEEYVCFQHLGGDPVDMTGWQVKNERGDTFTFPSFTLPVGASVRIHSGAGIDTPTDLYWGRSSEAWQNDCCGGDSVFLYDASGKPKDWYTY